MNKLNLSPKDNIEFVIKYFDPEEREYYKKRFRTMFQFQRWFEETYERDGYPIMLENIEVVRGEAAYDKYYKAYKERK